MGCSPQAPHFHQGRCTRQSAQHPQLVPAHSGACPDFQTFNLSNKTQNMCFWLEAHDGRPSKAREIAGLLGAGDTHQPQLLAPRGSGSALPQPAQARPEEAPSTKTGVKQSKGTATRQCQI